MGGEHISASQHLDVESAGGIRLAVWVDDGTSPVILLAHGVGSTATFVDEAFGEPLRAAGWRMATMDLRGHGRSTPLSDPTDHHLDLQAADVAAVAAATGAAAVAGISLGGHAVVRAAARGLLPAVRAVAAVVPAWSGRARVGEGPHAAVAAEIRHHGVAGMLERLRAATDLPTWLRDVLVRDYAAHQPASLEAALLALEGGLAPSLADIAALPMALALVSWPDDPGHPDEVARHWAAAATGPVAHRSTSIEEVGADRRAFGRALVDALAGLGVDPR